jgi:hypothetical protein
MLRMLPSVLMFVGDVLTTICQTLGAQLRRRVGQHPGVNQGDHQQHDI